MEVSPAGACNHRCIFCALDFMGYRPSFLDMNAYRSFVSTAARKGVRSIMFGGEGEPLLHPRIAAMTVETKQHGIDVAVTTNGVLLDERFCTTALPYLSWVKVSLDAGTAATHARIHRCSPCDFGTIMENIRRAVCLKKKYGCTCDIGVQVILLPENRNEVAGLAREVKRIGVDYFVVKPYSQGLWSANKRNVDYTGYGRLAPRIEKLSDGRFHATFRVRAFDVAIQQRGNYRRCNAVPFFWAYVATSGDVYSCSNFLGRPPFLLGNITRQPFDRIWEGERRKKNWLHIRRMPADACRVNCRMDSVNRYLEQLKHPPENYAFI